MHLCYRPYIVRQYGSYSSWVRNGLGPIRLGAEKVWVRVVPEILGPSRLGSELSDILQKYSSLKLWTDDDDEDNADDAGRRAPA